MTITYAFVQKPEFEDFDASVKLRDDLRKLANYLWGLPDDYTHFSMRHWYNSPVCQSLKGQDAVVREVNTCGTVACAVGHAAAAGIIVDNLITYSALSEYLTADCNDAFDWMFSCDWVETDNTSRGAAIRIAIALDHGIPVDANRQAWGMTQLCYQQGQSI